MSTSLDSELRRLRRRVRLLLAERYGLFGAAVGTLVATVLAALSYRYDELLSYPLWVGVIVLGALVGVGWAVFKKLSDLTIASAVDKRTGLKERFSTAVSLGDAPGDEMGEAVISDAGGRVAGIGSSQVFRHRFGLPHWVCGGAMVLLFAVIFVPQLGIFQSGTRRQEIKVMKQEGKKLVRIAKELKNQDTKHEELSKLATRLQKLGAKMQTGRMTKKQAMLKAQRLAKDVKKEQDRLAKENSSSKSMEQAQAQMRREAGKLAKSMADKMAKKENIPPAEALKKLPTDQQLAALAQKEGPLTDTERQQLEQAIAKYADPNNNSPIPKELGQALAKLAANSDFQRASELMRKVAIKLNGGQMTPANRAMLKQQMAQLAKALKNTDMDKLAKMMAQNAEKLAKMSAADLKKLAEQMAKMQKMASALAKAGHG